MLEKSWISNISQFSCLYFSHHWPSPQYLGMGLFLEASLDSVLRTFPNTLIANLALVDLLNALINIPNYMYLLWRVLT